MVKCYFLVFSLLILISCTKEKVTNFKPIPYGSDVLITPQNCIDTNYQVSYSSDLVPILLSKCYSCHDASSSINLIDYYHFQSVANSGQILGSLKNQPNYLLMPVSGQLDSCAIKLFEIWIQQGMLDN